MLRSKRFKNLANLAQHKERQAAFGLGRIQQQRLRELQRLEELHRYRIEYIKDFEQKAVNSMPVANMQAYRQLIDKLNLAIQQQGQLISEIDLQVEQARLNWLEQHKFYSVLEKLHDSYRHTELQQLDKREQAEQDDLYRPQSN